MKDMAAGVQLALKLFFYYKTMTALSHFTVPSMGFHGSASSMFPQFSPAAMILSPLTLVVVILTLVSIASLASAIVFITEVRPPFSALQRSGLALIWTAWACCFIFIHIEIFLFCLFINSLRFNLLGMF